MSWTTPPPIGWEKTTLSALFFSHWYMRCKARVSGSADEAMVVLSYGGQ
jgi:hypothetical protein